jgi:transcriptional regulator with XRE-family HTH domain
LNIDQIREALKDRRLYVVAEKTGIAYSTLNRIMRGFSANSTTLDKLEAYLATRHPNN